MRYAPLFLAIATLSCKGKDTDVPTTFDCDAYTSVPLATVPITEWPEGLADAVQAYDGLSGTWTAEACGTPIRAVIRTRDVATAELIQSPLEPGNDCGCTHDPDQPDDAVLGPLAYLTLDLSVLDYPHEGFREENAGNVTNLPVALFANGQVRVRACVNHLVPPVLLLDYTDNLITLRAGSDGVSGNVTLVGDGVSPDSCDLTNWVRTGDVPP